MDIFGVLTMIGGLALFLYGMEVLGDGLKKASGGKLEIILEKLTSNKIMAVLLGAGVTAIIQSSSATTVMVVGFVSSGIMSLSRAVGVILGANVGTTITAWILSLAEISGAGFIFELLKPTSFSPIFAIIGVSLLMMSKSEKKRNAATIMVGFAVLMFGMDMMSGAVKPLADVPEFRSLLLKFSNPILGMLVGLVFTAVIQSSSASVGVLQALCMSGAVSYATAIPIIMGQNIGTCVTALISSMGSSRNAKRTALVHLYYNFMKVGFFMVPFYILNGFMDFAFMTDAASATGVAVIHTSFNVLMLIIIFPFTNVLEKLVYMTLPLTEAEKEDGRRVQILDPIFLDRPALALEMCKNAAMDMARYAKEGMLLAMELIENYDDKKAQKVRDLEDLVDHYEDELGTYLMKINGHHMAPKDSQEVSILLHCIGDFERISDHSVNIMASAREMFEKEAAFSKKAQEELAVFTKSVVDILEASVRVFCEEDLELAKKVEPMEECIDYLSEEMKKRHVKRLRKGKCTIEMGFVLSDITTNYERVSDHCSNIAICLLQLNEEGFDTHEYQGALFSKDNEAYAEEVRRLREYYALP